MARRSLRSRLQAVLYERSPNTCCSPGALAPLFWPVTRHIAPESDPQGRALRERRRNKSINYTVGMPYASIHTPAEALAFRPES